MADGRDQFAIQRLVKPPDWWGLRSEFEERWCLAGHYWLS